MRGEATEVISQECSDELYFSKRRVGGPALKSLLHLTACISSLKEIIFTEKTDEY